MGNADNTNDLSEVETVDIRPAIEVTDDQITCVKLDLQAHDVLVSAFPLTSEEFAQREQDLEDAWANDDHAHDQPETDEE